VTDLEKILRHRQPMIFLDAILESSDRNLIACVRIREGIPFFEPKRGVPVWVGLEYMAQSIAALAGIRACQRNNQIPLGMIIGCRNYTCNTGMFAPDSELRISISELVVEENGFGVFDCNIKDDCQVEDKCPIAQARISVFGGDRQKAA